MQMAQNIRRYKGVRPIPVNKGWRRITLDGSFGDWKEVKVEYRDTRGDVVHRDAKGYGGLRYTDDSGRNDILVSKVAVGRDRLFFYVRTAEDMTPSTDPGWMLLLIDADKDSGTGWFGYDFLVGGEGSRGRIAEVLRYEDGRWTAAGSAERAVNGSEMEISLPRALLGLSGTESLAFDFKWSDNPGPLEDPISVCLHGDTAPNRRFNYRFIWEK